MSAPETRECHKCGRRGIRQFIQVAEGWKCAAWASCMGRADERRKTDEKAAIDG